MSSCGWQVLYRLLVDNNSAQLVACNSQVTTCRPLAVVDGVLHGWDIARGDMPA
jgi:hypothetical protein